MPSDQKPQAAPKITRIINPVVPPPAPAPKADILDKNTWPRCPECGEPNFTMLATEPNGPCIVCRMKKLPHKPCRRCREEFPAKFVEDGLCPACIKAVQEENELAIKKKAALIEFLGGERNFEIFDWEKFTVVPENQEAVDFAKKFEPAYRDAYFFGPTGGSKTTLAGIIARQRYEAGHGVIFEKARHLVRMVARDKFKFEEEEIRKRIEVETLIIDDLGVGIISEGLAPIFYEIITGRIDRNRHGLIVTSNLGFNDLAKKLGDDRIPSRLNGLCRAIKITGPNGRDWRDIMKGQGGLNV